MSKLYGAMIFITMLVSAAIAGGEPELPNLAWLHLVRSSTAPNYSGQTEEWAWNGGVALDPTGSLYVAGGTGSFHDYIDAILAKLNADGEPEWTALLEHGEGIRVAVDSKGNAFLTGLDFSSSTNESAGIVLAKFNSAGDVQWGVSWEIPGSPYDDLMAIATDIGGNSYVSGEAYSPTGYAYLVKFDSLGNLVWKKSWNYANISQANNVATDPNGNVYVAGCTGNDSFLVQFNSDGAPHWGVTLHEDNVAVRIEGMAVDSSGDIYTVADDWAVANDRIISILPRVLLAKFSPNGRAYWAESLGIQDLSKTVYVTAGGVAVDGAGDPYIVGDRQINETTWPPSEIYLAKFQSDGKPYWTIGLLRHYEVHAVGVGVNRSNDVYVVGSFSFEMPQASPPIRLNATGRNPNITVRALTPRTVESGFAVRRLAASRFSQVNLTAYSSGGGDGSMGTHDAIFVMQLQGHAAVTTTTTVATQATQTTSMITAPIPFLYFPAILIAILVGLFVVTRKRRRKGTQ